MGCLAVLFALEEADVEKLTEVPEIPRHIAEGIYGFFHKGET